MCNTKAILTVGLAAATVYTGGAAASLWGGVAAAGGATSYAGAIGMGMMGMAGAAQGLGQQQQTEAQQAILQRNAQTGEMLANEATARAGRAEEAHRAQVRGFEAQQRVDMAKSGTQLDFGSNAEIAGDTSYMGELDALRIRSNGAQEAWGYRNQADTSRFQSDLLGTKKKYELGNSLLTTGSAVNGIYRSKV